MEIEVNILVIEQLIEIRQTNENGDENVIYVTEEQIKEILTKKERGV